MPHEEFVLLVKTKVAPTFKLLHEAIQEGKVLAGGIPAGSRDWVLVVDLPNQNTHRVVRQFLQSLPIFELYDWQATPLETIAEGFELFEGE